MKASVYGDDEVSVHAKSKDDLAELNEFYNKIGRKLHGGGPFGKALRFKADVTMMKNERSDGLEVSVRLDGISPD